MSVADSIIQNIMILKRYTIIHFWYFSLCNRNTISELLRSKLEGILKFFKHAGLDRFLILSLIFKLFSYYDGYDYITFTHDKVSITPKFSSPQFLPKVRKILKCFTGRFTLHCLHYHCWRMSRRYHHKDLCVIFHHFPSIYSELLPLRTTSKEIRQVLREPLPQSILSILGYPDQLVFNVRNGLLRPSYSHAAFVHEKALTRQVLLSRLMTCRLRLASKLTDIQRVIIGNI